MKITIKNETPNRMMIEVFQNGMSTSAHFLIHKGKSGVIEYDEHNNPSLEISSLID